jgi:predicted Rossmann-fold nucleotide-binding protein
VHFFEFFKGFWCRPEAKPRLDKIEIVINMYGWHRDSLADQNADAIEAFLAKISEFVGRERLAVMHGKGPGFMRVADFTARRLGILSIGVGIDAEKVGQISNIMPEIALDFESNERLYRQKLMDHIGDIKVFNIGGFGTQEESAITICSAKLLEFMPAPMLYIDTSSGKTVEGEAALSTEHHWQPQWQQIQNISKTTGFEFANSEGEIKSFDLSNSPLGPKWVSNVCHCVQSYEDAADIVIEFLRDPLIYWKKHEVDSNGDTIKIAWNNYLKKRNHYQLRPARIYEDVLKRY